MYFWQYKTSLSVNIAGGGPCEDIKIPKCQTSFDWCRSKEKKKNYLFQSPFNLQVKTKIGQISFIIVNKHFPVNSVFYKNTIKINSSMMPNMEKIIKGHNQKGLMGKTTNNIKMCNWRKNDNFPLNRQFWLTMLSTEPKSF